jgi:hypothetical protein
MFDLLQLLLLVNIFLPNVVLSKDILIIGDSHVNGKFGSHLHNSLAKKYSDRNVLTISIGGAGQRPFNNTMASVCCGAKVRLSNGERNEVIQQYNKKGDHLILFKEHQGDLFSVMQEFNFKTLILNLTNNSYSAKHEIPKYIKLMEKFKAHGIAQVNWITPFLRTNLKRRLDIIHGTAGHFQQICTFQPPNISRYGEQSGFDFKIIYGHNEDLLRAGIGGPQIRSTHYHDERALIWADHVLERLTILDY